MAAFIEDDSNFMDNEGDSSEKDLPNKRQKFLSDNYWKNIPHVPDSEYYCHGD